LFEVLAARLSRRELTRRLDAMPGLKDSVELQQRVAGAAQGLQHRSRQQRLQLVVRALGHYARFRGDLKVAWQALHAMDQLRLTDDPEELVLSRANGLLQEFHGPGVELPEVRPVVGHVILKADVRGSTRLTAQMLRADLNPAAYFSRNLFNPINRLRLAYGAEKVFIEGDAVILAILEHPGESGLAVARACGLARKILQVMDAQNERNRRLGLPELELGLGIAYVDEPPAYLFDEGQRITISPAINRADRLSSCHAALRRAAPRAGGRGVEVVAAQGPQEALKSDGENLLRYNVNGIELDAPAFYKLRSELNLQGVTPSPREAERYYVGRYPDARGDMHWLVVREAPIRQWRETEAVAAGGSQRRFYEVVTDRVLLRRLCAHALAEQRKPDPRFARPMG
jgi:class 3 adenylate cyclase